jgi:ABC-type Fe3+/spermidine/putrescine transport system ATPase subunit
VALARALVLEPPILLLDEPLAALDLQLRKEMQLELRQLNRALGITFILVTHDQEEALVMSDRVAVMSEGRVVQIGSPAEIYEHPRTAFVANFIGDANVFTGTVRAIDGGIATIAQADGSEWQVPVRSAAVGGTVQIAVRPERHDLVAHPSHPSSPVNTLSGTIREIIFLGETLHVLVTLRDGAIARVALRNAGVLTTPLHWCAGDLVRVTWAPKDAQVLEP